MHCANDANCHQHDGQTTIHQGWVSQYTKCLPEKMADGVLNNKEQQTCHLSQHIATDDNTATCVNLLWENCRQIGNCADSAKNVTSYPC